MRASMLPERGVHAIVPVIGYSGQEADPNGGISYGVHPYTNDSRQIVRNSVPNWDDAGASTKKKRRR